MLLRRFSWGPMLSFLLGIYLGAKLSHPTVTPCWISEKLPQQLHHFTTHHSVWRCPLLTILPSLILGLSAQSPWVKLPVSQDSLVLCFLPGFSPRWSGWVRGWGPGRGVLWLLRPVAVSGMLTLGSPSRAPRVESRGPPYALRAALAVWPPQTGGTGGEEHPSALLWSSLPTC